MVLDSNQLRDVIRLKDTAIEMANNRWIPNKAAKRLHEILADESLDAKQFTQELQKIVKTTGGLNWDRFFSKIQTQVGHFSGISLFGILLIFFLAFVFRKTLFSKKTKAKLTPLVQSVGSRIIAVSAYFLCIFSLWANYGVIVEKNFPLLVGLFPGFIQEGAHFYKKGGFFLSIGYLLIIVRCLREHFPKPRILRFHLLQGFLLLVFQTYPVQLIGLVTQPLDGRRLGPSPLMLNLERMEFLLNLYWILTALYLAITLSYPNNKFLREALEIFLGPDEEGPDGTPFKWWDKQ